MADHEPRRQPGHADRLLGTGADPQVGDAGLDSAPTVGTDVPVLTIPAPAGATQVLNLGALGKRFATGVGIAVTAAAAATDTGVTVAGIQVGATYI